MVYLKNIKSRSAFMLRKFKRYLIAIQVNPSRIFRSLMGLPRYIRERNAFKKSMLRVDWPLCPYPVLCDWNAQSANLGEYFWQDLFVAKKIIQKNPERHVDVGSRVDGFIAHLACVRPVEIFDIRPLTADIDNVSYTKWDVMQPREEFNAVSDCVSCLHTLEHIGLGRYGDPIDPEGWEKGLASLVSLVKPGGSLWLSVPIGVQRVEFNAHRVFHPETIIHAAEDLGVKLSEFYYLDGEAIRDSKNIEKDTEALSMKSYGLGIFYFVKGR